MSTHGLDFLPQSSRLIGEPPTLALKLPTVFSRYKRETSQNFGVRCPLTKGGKLCRAFTLYCPKNIPLSGIQQTFLCGFSFFFIQQTFLCGFFFSFWSKVFFRGFKSHTQPKCLSSFAKTFFAVAKFCRTTQKM